MTILAHIGCFVPCQFASFHVGKVPFNLFLLSSGSHFHKVFYIGEASHFRIGTSDTIETNSSTFMREMIEMSFVVREATDRSLVKWEAT